ncbi:MAG: MBL fold metallo-hydrolase [Pseudomonadota bacterium]
MFLLNRRNFLELAAGTAAATAFAGSSVALADGHASADVFTADPFGGLVDSVVVAGEDKMLLIDAQFTVPNAERLADVLAATGKELETIFITHYHPDHHFGLSVLLDRFPGAKPLAHASVVPLIESTGEAIRAARVEAFPAGTMPDRVVIPEVLAGDYLTLEGERFDVLAPMHGDTDIITPVHIPQFDTLVASDMVYADTHVWVTENLTPERMELWRDNLTALEDMGVGTLVPGHRTETSMNDASGIAHTRRYLDAWEAALADTSTADDLKASMLERVGELPGGFFLDFAISAARG